MLPNGVLLIDTSDQKISTINLGMKELVNGSSDFDNDQIIEGI